MNFEQVTPKISLDALRALQNFNNKHGIHIVYNAERTVYSRYEKTSITPFPGYNIHYLVRFPTHRTRFSVRAGNNEMVEVGFRENSSYRYFVDECISGCWGSPKSFRPRDAPALGETIWLGVSFESGNIIKGYQNGLEYGKYDGVDWSPVNEFIFFHNSANNTGKVLQIHLFGNNTTRLFQKTSWKDCSAYHLYCGSVVTIKCKYMKKSSSYAGLSFSIGNVDKGAHFVHFPNFTNTGEVYVIQVFIGEIVYNIVSKDESRVIVDGNFNNTTARTYLDFENHNIVLDNVFMVRTHTHFLYSKTCKALHQKRCVVIVGQERDGEPQEIAGVCSCLIRKGHICVLCKQ